MGRPVPSDDNPEGYDSVLGLAMATVETTDARLGIRVIRRKVRMGHSHRIAMSVLSYAIPMDRPPTLADDRTKSGFGASSSLPLFPTKVPLLIAKRPLWP